MDRDGAIGKDGQLPWHLPADLQNFKRTTMGKPIVMGRKTHQSIGRALPGRENVVITREPGFQVESCSVVHSLQEALIGTGDELEVMIIGGASIYAAALPLASRIYLTEVHAAVGGDVYFPDFDRAAWHESSRTDCPADTEHLHAYSFVQLDRLGAT